MNKNVLIRAVSLIIAVCVLVTAYGCKKSESANGDINQPSIQDGTAVIEYTSTDKDGKEVDATKVVDVDSDSVGNLSAGENLKDEFEDENKKDKFVSRNEDFGIDDEKADEIVENAAKWTKFSYNVYIANSNAKRVAFSMLKAKNTENIIIDTNLGCEYGVVPGGSMMILIEGIVNSTALDTEEKILAELNEMDIDIIYTFIDDDGLEAGIDDWSKVTTAYMPVNF